ncbi:MAG: hypothetical protein R3178_09050, partial [Rhodothermales bacterium]|nr:hypothetical protein [Rhodothermales bacterium]
MLALLLGLSTSPLCAQQLQIVTRFDYYFSVDTAANLILFGETWPDVQDITIDGVPAERLAPADDAAVFRVDIHRYAAGDHSIPVRASLSEGQQVELVLDLRKLEHRPGAVRVDRLTAGLVIDDLPFFPFGFYAGYPVGDLPVQEIYNAMNLAGVYQSNAEETLAGRKAYMDLCAAVGIKVNYSVNGLIGTPHNQTNVVISEEEEERRWDLLRREVEAFKDHPALLAWYMNDEPVGQSRKPELLEKAYRIIKEIDPYHPVSVVFVVPDRAAPFANALDIAMTDPYPIPGDVMAVEAHMQALVEAFRYRKALWLVPQAFGGGEFLQREPTG